MDGIRWADPVMDWRIELQAKVHRRRILLIAKIPEVSCFWYQRNGLGGVFPPFFFFVLFSL